MQRDITEAADGMGYSWRGRLFGVDLPLAVPLIIAGLRVATVTTVGLVMVTALIGEGGLGQLMLARVQLPEHDGGLRGCDHDRGPGRLPGPGRRGHRTVRDALGCGALERGGTRTWT